MRRVVARLQSAGPLLAWSVGAIILTVSGLTAVLASGATAEVPWKLLIIGVVWAVPGVLISAGRPQIAVGWLILASAVIFAAAGASNAWVAFAIESGVGDGVAWAAWFADRFSAVLVPLTFLAVILLPDGRLPSARWKPVVVLVSALQVATVVAWALVSGPAGARDSDLPPTARQFVNPVGILPEPVEHVLAAVEPFVLQVPLLLAPIVFAVRLWRAKGSERTRIATILLAATVFVLMLVVGRGLWPGAAEVLDIAAGVFLAAVVTTAVLRRRLAGVDVVVHHAVLFTVLTTVIAGAYTLAVAVAALSSQTLPPFGVGFIAALVAVAALPLRGWLQLLVDRLLYGDRRKPYEALRRLAARTHGAVTLGELLDELAASIAASLRVPWVQVEVNGTEASTGIRPLEATVAQAPLVSQGLQLGTITAAAGPGRALGQRDSALLAVLGEFGGMAVQTMILAEAVTASRQRLVAGSEEERRALSRDLHDELGPTMASISMQLGTLRRIVLTDPQTAEQRLGQLELAAQEALNSVRSLARGLRPTVLDERGLAEAVRRAAESLGLDVRMTVAELPELSAAVEVAAYRIAVEALTNVARHSGARSAQVAATVAADSLVLEVTDAGAGFGDGTTPTGVGMIGMGERAEELGGTLVAISGEHGTTVTATLPLHQAPARMPLP
ncbi:sensor histidine kinase [Homoserinimonas sp. A520]